MNNKNILIPVDFFDHVYFYKLWENKIYSESNIEKLLFNMKNRGNADICLWRVSACGRVTYRSQVEHPLSGGLRAPEHAFVEVLEKYDPLKTAVAAADKNSIPLYGWLTLFDDAFIGRKSRLLEEHPECEWVDRTGKISATGIPCYDYDCAIDFRLKQISELLNYGVKGLMLSLRSHANQVIPYHQKDFFGFNDLVVEKYKKRYGVDLRKFSDVVYKYDHKHFVSEIEFMGNKFDVDGWHKLKGESLTTLLREVRKLVGKNFPVHICFLGPFEGMTLPAGAGNVDHCYEGAHPFARMQLDYQTWLQEDLIDGIIVNPHRNMEPEYSVEPFCNTVHELGGTVDWLYRFCNRPIKWAQTCEFTKRIEQTTIDGVLPYEAVEFDFDMANKCLNQQV